MCIVVVDVCGLILAELGNLFQTSTVRVLFKFQFKFGYSAVLPVATLIPQSSKSNITIISQSLLCNTVLCIINIIAYIMYNY